MEETIAGRDRMHAITLNVDDPEAIDAFASRVTEEHAGLNVLVNNAGIMRREDLTKARDLGDAERTIATNLLGPASLRSA